MSKNILYICPSSGLGGAETFLKTTFLKHQKQIFSPVYLLFQHGPLSDWLTKNGAIVEVLPSRPRLSRPWTFLSTHQFIKKIIDKHAIDLVHSTMAYGALFSSLACWQTGKPHLWFQHGPASGWMDQMAALLPHNSVAVNSNYTLQKQQSLEKPISWLINKRRFLQKITLGIEPPHFLDSEKENFKDQLFKKHNLSKDTLLFGMACRLQKWKGAHLVAEAVSQLKNKDFFVLIWGDVFDSDDYVKDLKKSTKNLPISFEGPIDNVPLAFAICDVVINASLQPEPFGLTLIEALSVGKALIAPNEGGPKEIIEEHKTGLLFEPRTASDLGKKMNWFIENKAHLPKYKENSLACFQKNYTSQNMMRQLEDTYKKLML